MAKLNKAQKAYFAQVFTSLDAQGNYAFFFNRDLGISAMAVFTGPMKQHVKIVLTYCGSNDTFKKKIGFTECAEKLARGEGVVRFTYYTNLSDCLEDFLLCNFTNSADWQTI